MGIFARRCAIRIRKKICFSLEYIGAVPKRNDDEGYYSLSLIHI